MSDGRIKMQREMRTARTGGGMLFPVRLDQTDVTKSRLFGHENVHREFHRRTICTAIEWGDGWVGRYFLR